MCNVPVGRVPHLKLAPGVKLRLDDCVVSFEAPGEGRQGQEVLNIDSLQSISINVKGDAPVRMLGRCNHGVGGGRVLDSSTNVQEHTPPQEKSDGAATEGLHGGCCVSSCSDSCLRLEIVDSKDGELITWAEIAVGSINSEMVRMVKAFENLLRNLQSKQAKSRPNDSEYLLRVAWPDGSRSPSQSLAEWIEELEGELR